MSENKYPLTWNLESIFPGGSRSEAFREFQRDMRETVDRLGGELRENSEGSLETATLARWVNIAQRAMSGLMEAESFVGCLAAQDMNDKEALRLGGELRVIQAEFQAAMDLLAHQLSTIEDARWSMLIETTELADIAFALNERRDLARMKLAPELESLIGGLAVDGYHAWSESYNTAVAKWEIEYPEGSGERLSAGQAHNLLYSPDREERGRVFELWEQEWAKQADYCADALNHLAGFRLEVYKRRGWNETLMEPLDINRMSAATLEAMWTAINRSTDWYVKYLERKAKLLGLEKLSWYDVEAPVGSAGRTYQYDDAAELIIGQFRKFSPGLAEFAEMAFRDGWIEAEDRPGKRPGGFCTSLPVKGETRIFMTYAGTASNVSTLAHELGHAYHQHVMNDIPALSQQYAMNVAETASTFAEHLLAEALMATASDRDEQIGLLEDKIQRAVTFFMNIQARFLFETEFYRRRASGLLSVEDLNELMSTSQKKAYGGALAEYHPLFWASKLHFYITEVPFYNFPYTFGFMFSTGLYARAKKDGASFADDYVALLRDTGRMTVEELAKMHLGVDLTKPDFWEEAVKPVIEDIEQFLALTD